MEVQAENGAKKSLNLHILRYLPTYWLYLLERYTVDNQRCTHTASKNFLLALLAYMESAATHLRTFIKYWDIIMIKALPKTMEVH